MMLSALAPFLSVPLGGAAWSVGFPAMAATAGSIAAGLCIGVGLCVAARWLWKREEKAE